MIFLPFFLLVTLVWLCTEHVLYDMVWICVLLQVFNLLHWICHKVLVDVSLCCRMFYLQAYQHNLLCPVFHLSKVLYSISTTLHFALLVYIFRRCVSSLCSCPLGGIKHCCLFFCMSYLVHIVSSLISLNKFCHTTTPKCLNCDEINCRLADQLTQNSRALQFCTLLPKNWCSSRNCDKQYPVQLHLIVSINTVKLCSNRLLLIHCTRWLTEADNLVCYHTEISSY